MFPGWVMIPVKTRGQTLRTFPNVSPTIKKKKSPLALVHKDIVQFLAKLSANQSKKVISVLNKKHIGCFTEISCFLNNNLIHDSKVVGSLIKYKKHIRKVVSKGLNTMKKKKKIISNRRDDIIHSLASGCYCHYKPFQMKKKYCLIPKSTVEQFLHDSSFKLNKSRKKDVARNTSSSQRNRGEYIRVGKTIIKKIEDSSARCFV